MFYSLDVADRNLAFDFFLSEKIEIRLEILCRDVCDMDDLCEIDSNVANEALVCIMVPTAGEKMKNHKHVLLGAYSCRLYTSDAADE